jgi:hypothetical protein
MQRRFILTAACTLALGLAAAAQAKPNFSGDWKLNVDKSDFGPMPPPTTMTLKIDHADPSLKVATAAATAQGEMNYDAKYTTDGKESTNSMGPMEAKSTMIWDGDDLAVTTKLDAGGTEIAVKGKWALSADGKTITQTAHVTSPQGEIDMKYVFDKQTK